MVNSTLYLVSQLEVNMLKNKQLDIENFLKKIEHKNQFVMELLLKGEFKDTPLPFYYLDLHRFLIGTITMFPSEMPIVAFLKDICLESNKKFGTNQIINYYTPYEVNNIIDKYSSLIDEILYNNVYELMEQVTELLSKDNSVSSFMNLYAMKGLQFGKKFANTGEDIDNDLAISMNVDILKRIMELFNEAKINESGILRI